MTYRTARHPAGRSAPVSLETERIRRMNAEWARKPEGIPDHETEPRTPFTSRPAFAWACLLMAVVGLGLIVWAAKKTERVERRIYGASPIFTGATPAYPPRPERAQRPAIADPDPLTTGPGLPRPSPPDSFDALATTYMVRHINTIIMLEDRLRIEKDPRFIKMIASQIEQLTAACHGWVNAYNNIVKGTTTAPILANFCTPQLKPLEPKTP